MTIGDEILIRSELFSVAEVAGFLWQRNWAEGSGGNISINLTPMSGKSILEWPSLAACCNLEEDLPAIADDIFYVTGAGKRMRDVAKSPLDFGAIIRIASNGKHVEILSEKAVTPTSELLSHLSVHNYLKIKGDSKRVVLHTHPTELIALTHCKPFLDPEKLTRTLWAMIPEARLMVPNGIGIVPYMLTGTIDLARATIAHLEKHDVVLWEKHGVLVVGKNIADCFDVTDTLTKAARIYIFARQAGFEPQGISDKQLDELAVAFNLPRNL